jgi:hypothetical protein
MLKPTDIGAYWARCSESGYEWYPVEIVLLNGEFMADDPDLGLVDLDHYHGGLTGLSWRKDGV